jgi:hypothetical protein
MFTFGIFEVEDGVVVSEEVDLIDSEWVCSYFFDDSFDNFIVAGLYKYGVTGTLLTTLTFLRWLPLPPVLGSPTFYLSLWILA